MKIILLDNFHWNNGYDELNRKFENFDSAIVTINNNGAKKLEEIQEEIMETATLALSDDDDYYYLINVHCIFRNPEKSKPQKYFLQDQLGVILYRVLLNSYEKSSDKLKVGFFSPIKQMDLTKMKPDNFVMNLFPFFEIPFKWVDCLKKLKEWKYPIFNVASENLLSGYKIYCSEGDSDLNKKVDAGKNKILTIDDQSNEWQATFNEIFYPKVVSSLAYKNQKEFRNAFLNNHDAKFVNNLKFNIDKNDLVITDFYLIEEHDPTKWMDKNEIASISGFQLYNDIKTIDKGLPVIMLTSSNKIPYYKVFDYFGVDDWIVKDTRVNPNQTEKRNNYILFKNTVEGIIANDTYKKLRTYWEEIIKVENTQEEKWWFTLSSTPNETLFHSIHKDKTMTFKPLNQETKTFAVQILKSSWFALRRMLNREIGFEQQKVDESNFITSDHFTASAVCNNLGKILEMLGIKSTMFEISLITQFILLMRNSASHHRDYNLFEVNDALICMDYILSGFNNNAANIEDFKLIYPYSSITVPINKEILNYPLFWIYLQFYNTECSKKCIIGSNIMLGRLRILFEKAKAANAIGPILKNNNNFVTKYTKSQLKLTDYEYSDENNQFKIKIPV